MFVCGSGGDCPNVCKAAFHYLPRPCSCLSFSIVQKPLANLLNIPGLFYNRDIYKIEIGTLVSELI